MGNNGKDCKNCQSEVMDHYADLQLKYDLAQRHIEILGKCLDVKEELCAFYRDENEQLKTKLKIY
jgi:hypothetical protein